MPALDAHRSSKASRITGRPKSRVWAGNICIMLTFPQSPKRKADTHRHANEPVGRPVELGELILAPTRDMFFGRRLPVSCS